METEPCDWLLVNDDVSRLTGDTGGVGLLHSECEREPGGVEKKGMNSDLLLQHLFQTINCQTPSYLCRILQSGDDELEGS